MTRIRQWYDGIFIRCKLHCERGKLFVSLLGGATYAAVSRDFRNVLHLRFCQRVYVDRDFKWAAYALGVSIYDNVELC